MIQDRTGMADQGSEPAARSSRTPASFHSAGAERAAAGDILRVVDLFSGLRGWSSAFADRGHDVFAIDNDPRFDADAYLDIGDVESVLEALPWQPDVVLASPPCTSFSTMTMGRMWTHDGQPKHPTAILGRRLVLATIRLIAVLRPRVWIVENPRARLRTLGLLDGIERRTVWYCQLGESRAKPTDLWGVFPRGLVLPPPCRNGASDHTPAPRGSYTGTQGTASADAARVPYRLSQLVVEAIERRDDPGSTGQLRLLDRVG